MSILYEGMILLRNTKPLRRNRCSEMTTHGNHQFTTNGLCIYQTTANNRLCWIYPYRKVEESISFEYILVALRALHNAIMN